ncbi:molybdenum cofactor guanylyltransferase [Anaerolineales bacterium HSG24]|nr:molybdenum cofactor guanylyltransferase [Anaerolineales bacterium HSG24]
MVSVAILAGGQSKRMGLNKAFLRMGGLTIIERIITQVTSLTDDLFISTNSPEFYEPFDLPLVADIYPDKAALGGVYSSIRAAKYAQVLVVACDMPLLNRPLLDYLITLAPTADIIAPLIHPSQPETLHTIYSKTCLSAIENCLSVNRLRIFGFFNEMSVRYVSPAEILPLDPHLHSFINTNTPEEWNVIKSLVNQQDEEGDS